MVAVLTGAQGGIGQALVSRLLSDGFFVIAIDKTDQDKFQEYKNVLSLTCDITNEHSIRTIFSVIQRECKYID